MALKVFILLYVFLPLGKVQESTIRNNYLSLGPSTIHHQSKGTIYEEKQKIIMSNAIETMLDNDNIGDARKLNFISDDPKKLNVKQAIALHSSSLNTDKNESDQRLIDNYEHSRNTRAPINKHFHSEKVVPNYKKNDTVETENKELAFDSLLINNKIVNPYLITETGPEVDIFYNRSTFPGEDANRRLGNNVISITPRTVSTHNGNNIPINMNSDKISPLAQNSDDFVDKTDCDDEDSNEAYDRNGNVVVFDDPTKGPGISTVVKSRMMLMDHPRVCYACSSLNDPSCWSPDRRTAVKYCRADHLSCLTNMYKYKGLSYIIRNCGKVCEQATEGPTRYTSCTICHHDLCNSSNFLRVHNVPILMFLIFQFQFVLNKSNSL